MLTSCDADSIHQVTINAANDMLSESELQSAITSLSNTQSLTPGNLRPSPHPSILAPAAPLSTGQHDMTSMSMGIEPELVEPAALQHSPSSHGLPDGDPTMLVDSRKKAQDSTLGIPSSEGSASAILSSTRQASQNVPSLMSTPQGPPPLIPHGGSHTTLSTDQFQQLEQLEPQLSNILQSTDPIGPDQYVIQTTPILELVSSAGTHTDPRSLPTTAAVHLPSIVQGVELPVAKGNPTITPIDATLEHGGETLYSELTGHVDQPSTSADNTPLGRLTHS